MLIRKLKKYKPTKFMNHDSVYDKDAADYAVSFIQALTHTKGRWAGKHFELIDWQEQIIRDLFGTIKPNGYRQFNTAYVEIPKKMGKQLSLDTLIPTPCGWKRMGEIQVGDKVFDEKGNTCNVLGLSEIDDTEQAYKVTLRNGETIIAGERHLWNIEVTNNGKREKTMTTGEMYRHQNKSKNVDGRALFRIRVASAFSLPKKRYNIDPYTYGFWLGNGCATKPEITVMRDDVQIIKNNIPYELHNHCQQKNNHSDILVYKELKEILVKNYKDKRILKKYLRGSYEQRLSLLQGLMDSDGCISNKKGQAIYCSILPKLANDVSELLWTLGIKNSINKGPSKRFNIPTGETCYNVKFTAFKDTRVSTLPRKMKNTIDRNINSRTHFHYIKSIKKTNNCKMRCIQVDSPSRLYLVGKSMIPTHNSELAAAIALLLTCGDNEERAEVYGCAADRNQASIVFNVAADMVRMCPALSKRVKILDSMKRLIYQPTGSVYQVLSADVKNKHGFNTHGVVFDELHTQPNRKLYDVMTKGSGDARTQPLYFLITTAGDNQNSICWEVHQKAVDLIDGRKTDPTFYPVIFGADMEDDWTDPKVWKKANPSLGITVTMDKVKAAFESARQNPAEENSFRQLRLNQWVKQAVRWMPMDKWDACAFKVDEESLKGRVCYGGLDLSSSTDITAFVLVFPPVDEDDKYSILPYFWIPEENIDLRVKRDHVNYDLWERQGFIKTTDGNVVHYGFIETFIEELGLDYNIREIAFDRWGAVQMTQNLEGMGFTVVPFGQGFKDMSPPTKELMKLTLEEKLAHSGHPVLRWMMDNIFVRTDPAGNIKPDKEKSSEKIDGAVATIMALDRALRNDGNAGGSVYDERGILVF